MFHFSLSRKGGFGAGRQWDPVSQRFFRIVAIPLLVGILLGSLIGQFSTAPSMPAPFRQLGEMRLPDSEALLEVWRCFRFPLFAALLSTSFLGVFLIPALSAYRGFVLGCSVAAAFQSGTLYGILLSLLSIGIPGLFGVPSFLLAASDSECISAALLRCVRMQPSPLQVQAVVPEHALFVALLCFMESLYICFLQPLLLRALQ